MNEGRYHFVTDCTGWHSGQDINDMIDTGREITRRTFLEYVNKADMKSIEKSIGYGRDFPMSRDWHVSYHRGTFRGVPAVWFVWSAIEHIFTLDGKRGKSRNPRRGRWQNPGMFPSTEGMLMGRLVSLEVLVDGRKKIIRPKSKHLGYLPRSHTLCIMHGPKSMNPDGLSGSVTKLHKQFHNTGPTKATKFTWPDPVGRKTDVGRIVALTYSIPQGLESPDKKNYLWHHEFGDHGERGHGPVSDSGNYPVSLMPMLQKDSRGNLFIKRMKGNKFYVTDWLYW